MNSLYLKELSVSLRMAIPLMLGMLAQSGIWLINAIMMRYLGPTALAAGALTITAYYLIFVLFYGMINAVGIYIAHAHGGNKQHEVSHYLQQGYYLTLLVGLLMTFCIWELPLLFAFLDQPDEVVFLAQDFLRGVSFGCVGIVGFSLFKEFNSSLGNTFIVMGISLLMLPIIVLLDYIFISGPLAFLSWGMFGIGVATSIVHWLMFFIILIYSLKTEKLKQYTIKVVGRLHWSTIKKLLKTGVPMAVTYFFEAGLFNISAIMMGWIGIEELAAHHILLECSEIVFMCFFAFAQVAAIRVSINIGKNDIQAARISVRTNLFIGFLIALSVSLIYICFPVPLSHIFVDTDTGSDSSKVFFFAKQFFSVASIFVFFDLLQVVANNVLRGAKDTFVPMLVGLGAYWLIGITSGYLFSFVLKWDGIGIWWGLTIGVAISSLFLWLRWFYLMRSSRNFSAG